MKNFKMVVIKCTDSHWIKHGLLGLAFDTFIFVLTQKKTQKHAAEMRRLGHSSVTQLIWRDGKDHSYDLVMPTGTLI